MQIFNYSIKIMLKSITTGGKLLKKDSIMLLFLRH